MNRAATVMLASLLLAGCVTASETTALIPQSIVAVPPQSPLSNAVSVVELPGEHQSTFSAQISDEALANAVKAALKESGMLADMDEKYSVLPTLIHLKQPMAGLDMTVTATINYLVRDIATNKVVKDQSLSTTYTAGMTEAFVGTTRVRLASEGAVRDNVAQFIDQLSDWIDTK